MTVFAKLKTLEISQRLARITRITRVSVVSLVALLGAACAGNSQTVIASSEVPNTPGNSLMGNYLAGLHAQADGDLGAASIYMGAALELDPGNVKLLRRAFLVNLSNGNMIDAVKLASRVIEVIPDDQFANLALAADGLATGNYEEARTRIDALDDGGLNRYLIPLFKSWSYMSDGKNAVDGDAALKALAPLSEDTATSLLHNAHAALINATIGNNDEAESLFIATLEAQGGMSLRKTHLFGAFYENIGEFDKAGAVYNGYIAESGSARYLKSSLERVANRTASTEAVMSAAEGASEALFDLTGSLRQQNAIETALIFSQLGLHMRPNFPTLQIIAGSILEGIRQYDSARKIYKKIDPASDYSWDAELRIATILDDLGQPEEAISVLRKMAAARPETASPLIDVGDIMRRLERYDEAIEAYEQAIERIPEISENYWSLYYALGIALERVKNWPLAEENFKKALELKPDQPYVLNYLAYSWVEKGLNLDEAMTMLHNARDQRPNDAYIIDSVGWAYYQLGNYDRAVLDLEEAAELLPQDPIVNDHLGDAYWQVGRRREARFQWKRALNLDPEPDTIELIEEKFKFGMETPQAIISNDGNNG